MSAVATVDEFQQGVRLLLRLLAHIRICACSIVHIPCLWRRQDYFEDGSNGGGDESPDDGSQPASGRTTNTALGGLQHLGLSGGDVAVNVCLLATLPDFRRAGVASQLFAQVINSARNAR
jgi:ribosomal protein S18 acetylase RimI-like enzyme